jgi:hypothetical protein
MSKKGAEHHRKASEHHSHAARHHGEAAKHYDAGEVDSRDHGMRFWCSPGRAGFARKHLDVNARSEINLACPDLVKISELSTSH